MSAQYYAIHTLSGKESKARDMLLSKAVAANLWQNTIMEIIIPTEKQYVTRRGRRTVVDKKVFPGYIFVKMFLDRDSESFVQSVEGISGFVRSGTKPVPMSDEEIHKILNILEKSHSEAPKSNFKQHDIVDIIAGPFNNFAAKVDQIDEAKGKIKAYVNIFGRDTLVELAIQDVELKR